MNVLLTLLLVVQILAALGMIGLILMQHGKGADAGAAFGGGGAGSASLFGASGGANFLSRTTAVLCGRVPRVHPRSGLLRQPAHRRTEFGQRARERARRAGQPGAADSGWCNGAGRSRRHASAGQHARADRCWPDSGAVM